MNRSPLIIVSLDGFAASAIGCYGSSWNETPTLDRLAGRGCVWDRFLASSDRPEEVIGAWTRHGIGWAERWRALGAIELITDSQGESVETTCFDQVLALPSADPDPAALPATEIAATQFGQLIAAAIQRASQADPWSVLWLHSDFLTRCWDAPRRWEWEEEIQDEPSNDLEGEEGDEGDDFEEATSLDDGELEETAGGPFPNVVPPRLKLTDLDDPDWVTDWMSTYACQIRLVDLLLDLLLEALESHNPTLVMVGSSGFRLGQGGWIGHRVGPLRSPDLRLPLIISRGGPLRIPQLTASDSLGSMLERLADSQAPLCSVDAWCDAQNNDAPRIQIDSDRALFATHTPNWFYVEDSDRSDHLFLKPDDLDDFNDVGRLRPDVIEILHPRKK